MPRNNKRPSSSSAEYTDRAFSSVSFPGTPGLSTDDVYRVRKAESFLGTSPTSAAKLSDYRRLLFMGPPVTRTAGKKMAVTSNQLLTPGSSQDQAYSQDHMKLENFHSTTWHWTTTSTRNPRTPLLGETLHEGISSSNDSSLSVRTWKMSSSN